MPTPTRSVPSRVTSATALRLVATRHQRAGRDLASTPPPVGFALSATPRSARPAHCSRYLRPYAPRSYSGLPCAREHLPHTGGDFSHDQPADASTAARSPSMVCSAKCDEICASKWIHLKVYPYVSSTWWGEPTWWSTTSSSPGSCASTDCGRSVRRSTSPCEPSPVDTTLEAYSSSKALAGSAICAKCGARGTPNCDRRRHLGVGRVLPSA